MLTGMSGSQNTAVYQPVRAPRGAALSCKGWQQEAVLRMLLNSLDQDVAERPQDLLICGAAGKAARDWDSFHSIVASLRQLEGDQSLVVAAGSPAGVSGTKALSPRVLVIDAVRDGLAGNWLYAGSQSALPAAYELLAAAARRHFSGTLAGRLVIAGGMGGAGGAQPLAATLNGAAFLGIDADAGRIKRRVKAGYCEALVNDLNEALRILKNAVRKRAPASVGLIGNCADVIPALARRGIVPDLFTDQTPAHAPFDGYIPQGLTPDGAAELRRKDPSAHRQRVLDSIASQLRGTQELDGLGSRIVASQAPHEYLQPLLAEERRLTTWLALSGEPEDIVRADRLALELFPADERLQRWLGLASRHVRFQGLPARVAWLRERDRQELTLGLNDLVARREIAAPVLIGCEYSPPESIGTAPSQAAQTTGEFNPATAEALLKVSPAAVGGACWVALHWKAAPDGQYLLAAQAIVADGTPEARNRILHTT
jgi:urocanate hydratase